MSAFRTSMKALSRHWTSAQQIFLGPSIKSALSLAFFLLSNDGLKQIKKKQSQRPRITNISEVGLSLIQGAFKNISPKDILSLMGLKWKKNPVVLFGLYDYFVMGIIL